MIKPVLILLLLSLVAACASPIPDQLRRDTRFLESNGEIELSGAGKNEAVIHYLGVGGFVIDYDGSRVYTAPFYSDPPLLNSLPLIPMSAKEACIVRSFPKALIDDGIEDSIVLVGHAHYDHLMDLPHLLTSRPLDETTVVGSKSTQRLINRSLGIESCEDESRAIAVEHNGEKTFGNVRIRPVSSHHAPHFKGITAMKGEASCKGGTPKTAWGWKMGKVYAYLIDFLDEQGDIEFRVFYQDSASDEGKLELEKLERKADVALIVMAGFHEVDNYPQSVIDITDSSLYVVGHWEDFFSGCDQWPPLITRGTNAMTFVERIKDVEWRMLYPDRKLTIKFDSD